LSPQNEMMLPPRNVAYYVGYDDLSIVGNRYTVLGTTDQVFRQSYV